MHWQRVLGHDGALTIVNGELFRARSELAASQKENRDTSLRNAPNSWQHPTSHIVQRSTHSEEAEEDSNPSSNRRGIFQFGNTAHTNPQDSPNKPGTARDPRETVFQPDIGRPGGLRVGATLAELHAFPSQASPLPNEFQLGSGGPPTTPALLHRTKPPDPPTTQK